MHSRKFIYTNQEVNLEYDEYNVISNNSLAKCGLTLSRVNHEN